MKYGEAIEALKAGKMVTRSGWNGKGMFLWLKPAAIIKSEWCKDPILKGIVDDNGGEMMANPTVCMKTADNKITTGWVASQTDMMAEDWSIYEKKEFDFELPNDGWTYNGVRFLRASVCPIGWDDADVNGETDDFENPKIPCVKDNGRWKIWDILIDAKTGQIVNWDKGVTASIYYKVADGGEYMAYDDKMNKVFTLAWYVPKFMDFDDSDGNYGYGDYIGLEIDENGYIENWPNNEDIMFFIDDFLATKGR